MYEFKQETSTINRHRSFPRDLNLLLRSLDATSRLALACLPLPWRNHFIWCKSLCLQNSNLAQPAQLERTRHSLEALGPSRAYCCRIKKIMSFTEHNHMWHPIYHLRPWSFGLGTGGCFVISEMGFCCWWSLLFSLYSFGGPTTQFPNKVHGGLFSLMNAWP